MLCCLEAPREQRQALTEAPAKGLQAQNAWIGGWFASEFITLSQLLPSSTCHL